MTPFDVFIFCCFGNIVNYVVAYVYKKLNVPELGDNTEQILKFIPYLLAVIVVIVLPIYRIVNKGENND